MSRYQTPSKCLASGVPGPCCSPRVKHSVASFRGALREPTGTCRKKSTRGTRWRTPRAPKEENHVNVHRLATVRLPPPSNSMSILKPHNDTHFYCAFLLLCATTVGRSESMVEKFMRKVYAEEL